MRGWLWEIYENNKPENIADINDEIKKMLTEAGETIGLIYINDKKIINIEKDVKFEKVLVILKEYDDNTYKIKL